MDSQHSGSDLIFLESEHYSLQISDSSAKRIHLTEGNDESRVTLSGNPVSVELIENNPVFVEKYGSISSPPLFFEQKDYVFILRPKNNKKVLITHENEVISTSFKNIRGTDITHGLVNFRNSIGYTKFIITLDGIKIKPLSNLIRVGL